MTSLPRSRVCVRRPALLASAVAVGLVAAPTHTIAQTQLPEIKVTTPSPVVRSPTAPSPAAPSTATAAPKAAGATAAPATAGPPPPAPTPLPGTIIVVDDAFAPVTVVTAREIEARPGATLTDTLHARPGIAGSTFAAGANRPVVRGLDNNRVRIQENGIGSHDVSALSEDHAVPVDPSAAEQVEVVRGPATLRYGSQAIGGVVSVTNSRIPEFVPRNGWTGSLRGGLGSVDRSADGAFSITGGAGNVVVHADAFTRHAGDYRTPLGRQANTFVDSDGVALGGSIVGQAGFIGVSVTRFNSLYGIPGEEAVAENKRIDMTQDKVQSRGELRVRDHGIEALRYWFGATRYGHKELVDDGVVGALFTNREWEGRMEVQHQAFQSGLGEVRGAAGIQLGRRNTAGLLVDGGAVVDGAGLLDPSQTRSIAAFWFEELQATKALRLQVAARMEQTTVRGRGFLDPDPIAPVIFEGERSFRPSSLSVGALYQLPLGIVARVTGQVVARAPDAAELFSKGAHEATGTFEIGNPQLDKERARSIEIGLKRAKGDLRFDASAFYTRYDGFIFKQLNDVFCDETIDTCAVGGAGELQQLRFAQRDATFYGVEIGGEYDVAPLWRGVWGIAGQYDFVRARFEDGTNVPRIPPHRVGAGIFYRDANWRARIDVLHAFAQRRLFESTDFAETPTAGYTLLGAEVSYTWKLGAMGAIAPEMTIGVRGDNLLDDDVRNHVSFKKDEVLQPGRGVRVFGVMRF